MTSLVFIIFYVKKAIFSATNSYQNTPESAYKDKNEKDSEMRKFEEFFKNTPNKLENLEKKLQETNSQDLMEDFYKIQEILKSTEKYYQNIVKKLDFDEEDSKSGSFLLYDSGNNFESSLIEYSEDTQNDNSIEDFENFSFDKKDDEKVLNIESEMKQVSSNLNQIIKEVKSFKIKYERNGEILKDTINIIKNLNNISSTFQNECDIDSEREPVINIQSEMVMSTQHEKEEKVESDKNKLTENNLNINEKKSSLENENTTLEIENNSQSNLQIFNVKNISFFILIIILIGLIFLYRRKKLSKNN
ncbi:hypothetical protein A0H76_2733 [Hepatospora eriocheir]|uniref:Uncharacterized protein n=1 Tax=Hepatospora eriocheir TaxID=1081669 RepID=A0A1X0QJF4_9MICR|nr:hypothetical protein A0H76_2733 [Hepatospora eriocheir]